jgi:hypothetical protein
MARAPDGARFSVCSERVARLAPPVPGAAARAVPQVDVEHALEKPRPRYRNDLMSVGASRSSRDQSSQ